MSLTGTHHVFASIDEQGTNRALQAFFGLLASVQLPFDIIDADFVKLALEAGPTIADDQIEIWGDVS